MEQENILDRHQARYTLQFRFLPEMIEACQNGELPIDALTNFHFWHKCLTDDSKNPFAFEWSDLNADVEHVNDNVAILKYTFPTPMMEPEASFAAVVLDREKKTLNYYTLEKSFNSTWAVCNPTINGHQLIAKLDADPTLDNFISDLKIRFNLK